MFVRTDKPVGLPIEPLTSLLEYPGFSQAGPARHDYNSVTVSLREFSQLIDKHLPITHGKFPAKTESARWQNADV